MRRAWSVPTSSPSCGRAPGPPRPGRRPGRRSGGAGTSRRRPSRRRPWPSRARTRTCVSTPRRWAGGRPAGQEALPGVGQAGQRRHDRPRVAVGPDDPGVGIGGEQGVEVPQVVGRLEDPALGRLAGLQGLEGEPVLRVGGRHVGLLEPAGVGGHVGLGLEGEGAHVVHEDGHALLGQGRAEGVHGLERRVELHQPVEVLGRLGDAGILGRLLQGRGRDGVGGLPLQQWPGHGVEPEQHGQQAGPGTGQADDDPRALDALVAHLGVLSPTRGGRCGWPARRRASWTPGGARRSSARLRPRRRARYTSSGSR